MNSAPASTPRQAVPGPDTSSTGYAAKGSGRALGVGEVKFSDMVLPENKIVKYTIDLKRVVNGRLVLGTADGTVSVDGKDIYVAKDLKVGLFKNERLA